MAPAIAWLIFWIFANYKLNLPTDSSKFWIVQIAYAAVFFILLGLKNRNKDS